MSPALDMLQPLPAGLAPSTTIDLRSRQSIDGYLQDRLTLPDGTCVLVLVRNETGNTGNLVHVLWPNVDGVETRVLDLLLEERTQFLQSWPDLPDVIYSWPHVAITCVWDGSLSAEGLRDASCSVYELAMFPG
jgi:hypothetical protein